MRISHESYYVQYYIDAHNVHKVWRNDLPREKFLRAGLLDSVTAVKSRMASELAARQSWRQSEAVPNVRILEILVKAETNTHKILEKKKFAPCENCLKIVKFII